MNRKEYRLPHLIISLTFCLCTCVSKAQLGSSVSFTHENWQTVETPNFRIHYLPELLEFAERSAQHLEYSVRLLRDENNLEIDERVEVVVTDVQSRANGFAIPASHNPIIFLFATHPQSDSVISNASSWAHVLSLHEFAHLASLAQKRRKKNIDALASLFEWLDLGELRSPRWFAEGYATLVESRITQQGRLFDNYSEAFITQLALEGQLPRYTSLNGSRGYKQGQFAYTVSVRFMQWLEQMHGEHAIEKVWRRLKAYKKRSFSQAFKGVFGHPPQALYARFAAEYTHKAFAHTHDSRRSKLWLDLNYYLRAPQLSPDLKKLALIQTTKFRKSFIDIYSTEENKKARETFVEANKALLKKDPLDIPDIEPPVFKRKKLHRIASGNAFAFEHLEWLDNESLIYSARHRVRDGRIRHGIFIYNIQTQVTRAINTSQNVRRFDVDRENRRLLVENQENGKSQLGWVDIKSGDFKAISALLLARQYDFPRIRPKHQGQALALRKMDNTHWHPVLIDLKDNSKKRLSVAQNYQFLSYPAWSAEGDKIIYAIGLNGEIKMALTDLASNQSRFIETGQLVPSWPMWKSDSKILFLAENSAGRDVFEIEGLKQFYEGSEVVPSNTMGSENFAQAISPPLEIAADIRTRFDKARDHRSSEYGFGKTRITGTFGLSYSSTTDTIAELGLKGRDIIGRLEWNLNIGQSVNEAIKGISGNTLLNALPFQIGLNAHRYTIDPMRQQIQSSQAEIKFEGISAYAVYPLYFSSLVLKPYASALKQSAGSEENITESAIVSLGIQQSWSFRAASFNVYQGFDLMGQLGDTTGEPLPLYENTLGEWNGYRIKANLEFQYRQHNVGLKQVYNKRDDEAPPILVGGINSNITHVPYDTSNINLPASPFFNSASRNLQYSEVSYYRGPTQVPLKVFLGHLDDNGEESIKLGGIKIQNTVFAPLPGANKLRLEFGLAHVSQNQMKNGWQSWLAIYHRF